MFVDRLADRIRRRGENVASADVEHVLGTHPDAVVEAAVVAVKADEEGGEDEIKACLVLADGRRARRPSAFWAWCDERLPYFAVPRYVELYDALPKTPTEKVLKQQLRVTRGDAVVADRGPSGRRGVSRAGPVSGAR